MDTYRTTRSYNAYNSWVSMKSRCLNLNHISFKHYGARGITVCKRWLKFENFLKDMGERPEGTTLERINNDSNYNKKNCKWASLQEQQQNKRSCLHFLYKEEKLNLMQIYKKLNLNMNYITFNKRIKRGWSLEEAINAPLMIEKRNKLYLLNHPKK